MHCIAMEYASVGPKPERTPTADRDHSRSTALLIQNRDGSVVEEPIDKPWGRRRYYAEVAPTDVEQQSSIVERIINVAFDMFGARHLEVRVLDAEEHYS